jgi:hypothetical protein
VTAPQSDQTTEPHFLRGWLIFMALFIVLQLILPVLFFILKLIGLDGNLGYIELFQQVEGDQMVEFAVAFVFDLLSAALLFGLWAVLGRKFLLRKPDFAKSFLKTLLLSWACAFGFDVLRAIVFGIEPSIGGYGGLVFGLGLAQWLTRSARVKAVFVR